MKEAPVDTAGNQFHIVGIGASAGGWRPLRNSLRPCRMIPVLHLYWCPT
jgi:hypothetical protein